MTDVFRLEGLPRILSKKNARRVHQSRRHRAVKAQEEELFLRAAEAIWGSGLTFQRGAGPILFPTVDVELRGVWHAFSDTVDIEVRSTGREPKRGKNNGRGCDAVGMPELVCDALQRVVYANDSQISRLVWERHYD